jgi:GR25 family glycosyltransferase involved in LPS biosynthesis
MEFSGRYINMAASTERRGQMEEQFARLGCADRYERFDAVDGRSIVDIPTSLSPAELGCFMSHYHCITAGGSAEKHVHIVEDDVVFAAQTVSLLSQVPDEIMDQCDILFTDIFVPLNAQAIFNLMEYYRPTGMIEARRLPPDQRYPSCLMFANIRPIDFGGATSYVVNKNSRHKLRRLLDQRMNHGVSEPIDMAIRKMANAGELSAYCVLPFLTSIRPDSIYKTTMVDRGQDKSTEMAFFLLRNYFFVGKDEDYIRAAGEELAGKLDDPGFMDTILSVFRFMFSEKFVQF